MKAREAPARLHQIDGLRALAALMVVAHHAGMAAVGEALISRGSLWTGRMLRDVGASGVEMFFVLSGVVLLRPYLRRDRPMHLASYVKRRAERLWPPYLIAWVLAGAFVYCATRAPTWWVAGANLPQFDAFHWVLQAGILYFGHDHYNFAWWSLSVEILFYLLVPVIVWGRGVLNLLSGRADLVLLGLAAASAMAFGAPDLPWLPDSVAKLVEYAPCFMGGVVLAKRDLSARFAWLAIATGAVLLTAACAVPALNVHVGYGLLYLGIVARIVVRPAGWLSRWHLIWLGERSYSLFLTHFTVFGVVSYFASYTFPQKGLWYFLITRAVELPLAMLLAMLVFHFIERRFATNLVTAEQFWPLAPGAIARSNEG